MRLKTKLVLAITALVFLIAGLVSLVYVHQLVKAAVQQTYDTNRMVADQVWFALQQALETGLKDRTVDPNNPAELRALVAATVRKRSGAASGARLSQPLLANGVRREHRRQPGRHAAEHQSRQPGQAAAAAAQLYAAPQGQPLPDDDAGLWRARGL